MESMHPLVQYGSSMRASGVPKRFSLALYSHISRPQPYFLLTLSIVSMTARYSG